MSSGFVDFHLHQNDWTARTLDLRPNSFVLFLYLCWLVLLFVLFTQNKCRCTYLYSHQDTGMRNRPGTDACYKTSHFLHLLTRLKYPLHYYSLPNNTWNLPHQATSRPLQVKLANRGEHRLWQSHLSLLPQEKD